MLRKKHSKQFVFLTAAALLFVATFIGHTSQAAVVYEQSKIGVPYDLFQDQGAGFGFYTKYPQYSGTGPFFPGGGVAYSGTVDWLRVKRLSGVSCDIPSNINITTTDGQTFIGRVGTGSSTGPYCDFPITGLNRTDMSLGWIGFCIDGTCNNHSGTLVLDGSPENKGYVIDGTQTIQQAGGWAFQLCDAGGCSGGFQPPATTTATSTPPAKGASSILFLPGIMGSRLYEESAECGNGTVTEKQRWFSTDECSQLRLRTDFTGQSLNSLYTKPGDSSIIDNIFLVSPLYGGFLKRLAKEKAGGTIVDYRAIPYDWRLKLEDILKTREVNGKIVLDNAGTYKDSYIYHSLQELVTSSKSGKVTIVTHSNGGLLAKLLLLEMKAHNDPLLDKIDNLILVAVPQNGTPDAVVSILHGAELGGGFIINQDVSRQIVNTTPFSHQLLPTEKYFSGSTSVQTPVIKIEPGTQTDAWRTQFGSEINTKVGLYNFLSKDSGRAKPAHDDLLHPEVVDNFLLHYADTTHVAQSSFTPPSTMKVAQVAGVGASTLASITYFTDKECTSRSIFSFFQCTGYRDKLGSRVLYTNDGDGTVVVPSALAMSDSGQTKRVWVNLDKYNDLRLINTVHSSILEVPDIQDFIFNTVEATTSRTYTYLGAQAVTPVQGERLVFQLHSPLDMWVSTQTGVVSSSTQGVKGAFYRRIGELQYIEVPASERSVQVHMLGQKTGSFTLDTERWTGTTLGEHASYVAVPTATGTKVTVDVATSLAGAVLKLDREGDGVIDAEMNTGGQLTVKPVVTYSLLVSTIEKLALQKSLKQRLLTLVKSAEYVGNITPSKLIYRKLEDALLDAASDLIRLYTNKRYITATDSKTLLDMVKILRDKQ